MGDDHQPRILKQLAGLLAGVAAVLVAAAGLRAAIEEWWPAHEADTNIVEPVIDNSLDNVMITNPTAESDSLNEGVAEDRASNNGSAAVVPPQPAPEAPLPVLYSKPNGVIEKRGDLWFETDTAAGVEISFEEVRRSAEETILYDRNRDLYLYVPTRGGTVRWSHPNPLAWTDLYVAEPAGS